MSRKKFHVVNCSVRLHSQISMQPFQNLYLFVRVKHYLSWQVFAENCTVLCLLMSNTQLTIMSLKVWTSKQDVVIITKLEQWVLPYSDASKRNRQSGRQYTVMILSFRTDRSGQTVQTQIRLLLEEQSDQGLHCLQFPLHLLDALLFGKAILFTF